MNILLAAMALDIGGAETHVVALAKGLKKMGHSPIVVSAGGVFVKELEKAKIPHYEAPLNKKDIGSISKSLKIFKDIIKDENIELIHGHGRIPALNGKITSILKGIPFMTTAHAKFKVSFVYRYTSFWGEEVISVSEDVKEHLINKFSVKPEKITLITNGIDTTRFTKGLDISAQRKELRLRDDTMKVIYSSRIAGSLAGLTKMVIEAAKEIYKENDKIEFIIVGDGEDFKEIYESAEKVNAECKDKFIHMLGKRTDMPQILSLGDTIICVARTALEAMACEKPVILAGGEGYMGLLSEENMETAISNNFTGRTTSEEVSVEKLKHEIIKLLHPSKKERRKELGNLGRNVVVDKFSIENMVRETVDIYYKLLKGVR